MHELNVIVGYQGTEVAHVKSRTTVTFLDTILESDVVKQCDALNIST
jgi:hypothetical protein